MEDKGGNTTLENGSTFTETTPSCKIYRFIMSVGITGSLCIFGIVGNILTLLVFSKFNKNSTDKNNRSSAPLLLSGLAISDFSLLFILFLVKSVPSFISFTKISTNFFVSYIFSFLMVYGWNSVDVAQCVNTWITVLVTMHRFIAIIFPHKAAVHCTYSKARIHLIIICVIIVIYEIPIFFDNEVKKIKVSENNTIYVPAYRQLNLNHWYQILYKTTFYYIIMYIIPWILLAIMTVFLVKAVKHSQQFRCKMGNNPTQQDNTEDVTMSLIAVVITSLVCRPWEPIRRIFVAILHNEPGCGHYYFYFEEFPSLTAAVNSSANFVLYCLFLKRFPETLKDLFVKKKSAQNINSVATSATFLSEIKGHGGGNNNNMAVDEF